MNRYQIQQMLDGVRENLKVANTKLNEMYSDSKTTIEARTAQAEIVKDLEEREIGLNNQLKVLDEAISKKAEEAKNSINDSETEAGKKINAKAEFYKATMAGKEVSSEVKAALGGFGSGSNGGEKFLPTTLANDILTEPFVKNPLRNLSTFTAIKGLEVPVIDFTIDDANTAFLTTDSETAKEIAAAGSSIEFGRNKIKIFVPITDTLMHGTNTNLVSTVDAALQSGLAYKEKQIAFATSDVGSSESFYTTGKIKEVEGATMYEAIINAAADLDDMFGENASVTMSKKDYFKMIKELANGNATLYMAQPKAVLGMDVEFCDKATVPVVGDYRYSHYNYDPEVIYDRDKNVKTGIYDFVLTAWIDHKIKLKSAFRKAKVATP